MSLLSTQETSKQNGINYVVKGKGPPVVLLHGIAASLHDWTRLLPDLARAGFRAYAPDLPGHGESSKPIEPEQYHVEAILSALSRWIESLDMDQPIQLVGHSLGGYLSLMYANRHPDKVLGLTLIDPFYSPDQLSTILRLARRRPALGAKTMRLVPEWLINTVLGWDPSNIAEFSPQARQQIANDYKRASPHFVYITQEIPDLTPSLSQVKPPSMVIWGERDMTLRPESFSKLVEALPNATGNPIADCGHQPHIGRPNLVNKVVLDFITTLPAFDSQSSQG